MEISDVRRQVRQVIERARRDSLARRARTDAAGRAYDTFLGRVATPVFHMVALALKAEGYPFKVFTPAGGIRLMSERSADDYLELQLDTEAGTPTVIARINRRRGRRLVTTERPIREDAAVEDLTEEDVLRLVVEELASFVER